MLYMFFSWAIILIMQTSDRDERVICYIVNSAEYCHKTVSYLMLIFSLMIIVSAGLFYRVILLKVVKNSFKQNGKF